MTFKIDVISLIYISSIGDFFGSFERRKETADAICHRRLVTLFENVE